MQELLKMAKVVIPEEGFYKKELETKEDQIKELAKIGVKLEIYAYKHKDEIEGLKASVEEIKSEEKTAENREELLQKIESLETRYKVFGRYIKENDWENLYRTKFDILMSDINKRKLSPIAELHMTDLPYATYHYRTGLIGIPSVKPFPLKGMHRISHL